MRIPVLVISALWLLLLCAAPAPASAQQRAATPLAAETYAEDFDVFWRFVRDNYAYFHQKKTDWNEVRAIYRKHAVQAQSTGAFIGHLEDALEELYDHHAHLGVNTAASPRLVPSGTDLWAEWQKNEAVVTAVRAGSAAEKAGLRAGMVVVSINGRPVAEVIADRLPQTLTSPDASARAWALRAALAGRQNRPVRLTVRHEEQSFTFTPGKVNRPNAPLTAKVLDGNVGYLRIHDALGDYATIAAFDSALVRLQDTRGLVLDLRDTPGGGNTTVARGLMSRLISEENAYQRHELPAEVRRHGVRRVWVEHALPRGPFTYEKPIVALVGRWTGSMGEGLAIGLDGMNRAAVVGTPMAGLRGALHEHTLPNTEISVRIPAERLYHVNGTPREAFEPAILTKPTNTPRDATLQRALSLLRDE